ncbi:MAG: DUF86 domain-containing protein [Promethearchaeota archaeon]|nr:MAG: DUF86 domain-containing protein [Candidatus Lokiarchaeota archaeon]
MIGEATKNIPKTIRKKYTNITWKNIAGMRDKLIHAYSEVDLRLIWMIIKQRLPGLKSIIEELLHEK